MGLTKALAREVGSRGITVNCIAPGFIDTDMTRALQRAADAGAARPDTAGPPGRSPTTSRAAVVFLASPAAAYITGETLHVNGGMYMN